MLRGVAGKCGLALYFGPDQRQVERDAQIGLVDGSRQLEPVRKAARRHVLVSHHKILAHAEHRVLVEIGVVLGEHLCHQGPEAIGLDDEMQVRGAPRMAAAGPQDQ